MEMNLRLQNLANRVRDVLGCSSVILLLECSDPILRHPLVSSLPTNNAFMPHMWRCRQNKQLMPLLHDERIRAVYDMALQTSLMWCIDSIHIQHPSIKDDTVYSIVVAPLERPDGIIGFFLCVADQPGAFYMNRCALLEQRLPELAYELESILKWYDEQSYLPCAEHVATHSLYTTEPDDVQLAIQEQNGFISLVSHELRVPLTAIKGYAGLLQAYSLPAPDEKQREESMSTPMSVEKQQHYLNVIMEQTSHMEVLVNDLLDLSGLEAGRLTLHYGPVDIVQVCQHVIRIAQGRIGSPSSSTHALRLQCPVALPPIWADPDRVEQVLTNLVDNAIKYSPDGGSIDVIVTLTTQPLSVSEISPCSREIIPTQPEREISAITVTVRDEGMGMSLQEQAVVTQPFMRGQQPATKKIAGYGLGLYLVRVLIEAMHGTLSLRSKPGQGTTVTFTLPLACAQNAPVSEVTRHKMMVGV